MPRFKKEVLGAASTDGHFDDLTDEVVKGLVVVIGSEEDEVVEEVTNVD